MPLTASVNFFYVMLELVLLVALEVRRTYLVQPIEAVMNISIYVRALSECK